jgi:hypothetical protein
MMTHWNDWFSLKKSEGNLKAPYQIPFLIVLQRCSVSGGPSGEFSAYLCDFLSGERL